VGWLAIKRREAAVTNTAVGLSVRQTAMAAAGLTPFVHSTAHAQLRPFETEALMPPSSRSAIGPCSAVIGADVAGGVPGASAIITDVGKEAIRIEMDIKLPPKVEKFKKKKKQGPALGSMLSSVFTQQKFPEPVYFQSVDCVGLPKFLSCEECDKIVAIANGQGYCMQHRPGVVNMHWSDIIDPFFAEALWQVCGLGWFLRTITIDGMVPCGLNDVIRIQRYVHGCHFGRHTDQHVLRDDGRVSKYSLRVFLNGMDEQPPPFTGGVSVFHVPFMKDPVVFEPEIGLALLYPQGGLCNVQEETEVLSGVKYVLRADVLFCKPGDLQEFGGAFGGTMRAGPLGPQYRH
jgi:hypothetical protein